MAYLVGTLMAMAAGAMGILLSRVERVRIQPVPEPNPAHNRRRSDSSSV